VVVRTGRGGGEMIMMPDDVGENNLNRCSERAMGDTANGGEFMVESAWWRLHGEENGMV
jgi:hypothetical protein